MSENTFDRAFYWALVTEWTTQPHLIRHMLAVEAAMRGYARLFNEDETLWGNVGLIHDYDYERNPRVGLDGHPGVGVAHLKTLGVPEVVTRAILSHASEATGVEPESRMEKTLVAVDELTGMVIAAALVRPSKKLAEVEYRSIQKRWREKSFAAGVHREEIEQAAERLGVPLAEHIQIVLDAMKLQSDALGL